MIRIKGNPDELTLLFLPKNKGTVCDTPRKALDKAEIVAVLNNCFGIIYKKDSKDRIISYYIDGLELLRY